MEIEVIISGILTIVAALFGSYLVKFKKIINDLRELFEDITSALGDNTITSEEWSEIKAAFTQLLSNFTDGINRKNVLKRVKKITNKKAVG
jgi:flagellar motor component MotA